MIKMMTKGQDSQSEMAHARLSDGISVIFDQDSPPSSTSPQSRSRSRSRSSRLSSGSSGSSRRPREAHRGRHRSSSSCSSTSSSPSRSSPSRPRSRSHPRCHRPSSRCRCGSHHRYVNGNRRRRSPPRRYRSRSRSASQRRTYRRFVGRNRCRVSRSPSRTSKTYRSRSGSRSSGHSAVSLSLDDKRELLRTAKANATKILEVEQLEIPESVKPILQEQPVESKSATPEPEARVRPESVPEKTPSQSSETEPDEDVPSPKMSPKRKIISFSIHNSVAKPTVAAPSSAKVTPRMDSIESRKPYGHWVPIRRTGRTSLSRKHTLTTSR
ncbi:arginine/serine-rich protein 1 [Centroberyx gerrardi]